jgi:biopolymer transport protein ExbD
MLNNKKGSKRTNNEINAGSMADIAFLLLIFFLVTTTIEIDKGILVRLPEWSETPPESIQLKDRNVFSVLVNANNELLVRNEPLEVSDLREKAKDFIMNPRKESDLSESPKNAVISLKNDRGTKYKTYIAVYNELKGAYDELWDEECQRSYGVKYSDDLPIEIRREIKNKIPMILSEAEPTAFGEEG